MSSIVRFCEQCGTGFAESDQFCTGCGSLRPGSAPVGDAASAVLHPAGDEQTKIVPSPPPSSEIGLGQPAEAPANRPGRRSRRRAIAAGLAALVVVLAAAVTVVAVVVEDGDRTAAGRSGATSTSQAEAATTTTTITARGTTESTAPPATVPTPTTRPGGGASGLTGPDAQAELDRIVERDRAEVSRLSGAWVPQLSSKPIDGRTLADHFGSRTYDDPGAVLANYEEWVRIFPQAVLLDSSEWVAWEHGGFYVILVPVEFWTADDARHWCDVQSPPPTGSLAPDDCFAKFLSSAGPDGTACYREPDGNHPACP